MNGERRQELMSINSKGLTIYKLLPREVENYLAEKYGDKLAAVKYTKRTEQNQAESTTVS